MNAGMLAMLQENLRFLKLSAMTKNLENIQRQALENKLSYNEFFGLSSNFAQSEQ